MKKFRHVVVHYDEIGLKSRNRGGFERLLMENIRTKLGEGVQCRRDSGQITLELSEKTDREKVCLALSRIPGIAYFSPAYEVPTAMEAFCEQGVELLREAAFETFRVDAHRHIKELPFKSMEVNREVGTAVLKAFPEKKVNLSAADLTLKIEAAAKGSYMSCRRIEGVGGLPTNPSQKVVALLSGGLDSPVAAYLMMKRGCRVILVHYQNRNQMTASVEDKIHKLAEQLAHFQTRTVLHIIPFEDLQKEIIKCVPSTMRMLFYRHVMLALSTRIARRDRCRFLVTGDCLSQVASQTYENLSAIYEECETPVLSPLIGMDKKEIVAISRRIGTYDISALPYDDCCTFFVPKHPELRARAATLQRFEEEMGLAPHVETALENMRSLKF